MRWLMAGIMQELGQIILELGCAALDGSTLGFPAMLPVTALSGSLQPQHCNAILIRHDVMAFDVRCAQGSFLPHTFGNPAVATSVAASQQGVVASQMHGWCLSSGCAGCDWPPDWGQDFP